jgi:cytidylate kinase
MTVITISREFGSGGSTIAADVANALGYHFADKDLVAKILSQYGFIRFGQEYDARPGFWSRFNSRRKEMVQMLNRSILALAAHGNFVILGRGSFALLAGYHDVLNVRSQAPLSVRIEQVAKKYKISLTAAEDQVNENDLVRSNFIESSYNIRWDSTSHFDLVIDTSKVPAESAAQWIIETARQLAEHREDTWLSVAEIDVSPVLTNVVSQTVNCYDNHMTGPSSQ